MNIIKEAFLSGTLRIRRAFEVSKYSLRTLLPRAILDLCGDIENIEEQIKDVVGGTIIQVEDTLTAVRKNRPRATGDEVAAADAVKRDTNAVSDPIITTRTGVFYLMYLSLDQLHLTSQPEPP